MVPMCLLFLAVCYHLDTVIGNTDQEEVPRTAITGGNAPKSIESALYSIESRLRELDLVYVARSYAPRHQAWDTEQYTRRLDTIESRIGRIEALLEMRLDKITESMSANQLKQTLANDQMNRKIETLSDRLNHRMSYMENRFDLDVAKIQSSIDSGFTRLARSESEGLLDSDIETQLQDLQRQFDTFDISQNATHAKLSDLANRKCVGRTELNDAEEVDKEYDRSESERFAHRMENVATKVHKMVEEFSQRSQTMESLVKTSMSLANATRRELQDGLKTLGLRLGFYGKHNKESTFEFGWDALATLITKEFARVTTSHDKLMATQQDFRQSCHRLQDKEQQLSETVAKVLDGILDLIRNRSLDMDKQVSNFQEVLKHHNNQILQTVSLATKTNQQATNTTQMSGNQENISEKLQDDLLQILAGTRALQEQLSTFRAASNSKEPCADVSSIADKLLASINSRLQDTPARIIATDIEETTTELCDDAETKDECEESKTRLHEQKGNRNVGKGEIRQNILDILDEEHGETLHYNVTEGGNEFDAKKQQQTSESIAENSTEGLNDYDFDKTDKSEQVYDEEVDLNLEEDIVSEKHSGDEIGEMREVGKARMANETESKQISTVERNKIQNNITSTSNVSLFEFRDNSTISEGRRMQATQSNDSTINLLADSTTDVHNESAGVQFSSYWHRIRHVVSNTGGQKTSGVSVEGGETTEPKESSIDKVQKESSVRERGHQELKMLDRAQINDDNNNYNDYEE